ncbi:MAG: response regulator [Candidatus Hydrogenedentota bacterium]
MSVSRGPKNWQALVVEDMPEERELIRRALEKYDIETDVAADGVVANNRRRVKRYDIVISDLRMPRKHGHQLIHEILSEQNPPLVLAVTGIVEPRLILDLMRRGLQNLLGERKIKVREAGG